MNKSLSGTGMSLFADVLVVFGKGGFNTHGGNGRCGDNKKARGPLMGPRAEFARITVCLVEFFGVQQFCLGIFGRSDELQRLAGVKVFEEVDERDPVFDHAASNGLNSLRQHRFLGAFFHLDRYHIERSTVNGDFGTSTAYSRLMPRAYRGLQADTDSRF